MALHSRYSSTPAADTHTALPHLCAHITPGPPLYPRSASYPRPPMFNARTRRAGPLPTHIPVSHAVFIRAHVIPPGLSCAAHTTCLDDPHVRALSRPPSTHYTAARLAVAYVHVPHARPRSRTGHSDAIHLPPLATTTCSRAQLPTPCGAHTTPTPLNPSPVQCARPCAGPTPAYALHNPVNTPTSASCLLTPTTSSTHTPDDVAYNAFCALGYVNVPSALVTPSTMSSSTSTPFAAPTPYLDYV